MSDNIDDLVRKKIAQIVKRQGGWEAQRQAQRQKECQKEREELELANAHLIARGWGPIDFLFKDDGHPNNDPFIKQCLWELQSIWDETPLPDEDIALFREIRRIFQAHREKYWEIEDDGDEGGEA